MTKYPIPVTTPEQLNFDLQIAAEREIDGVGMGVLTNGTPFLTLRGLARMCGVDHAAIVRITEGWQADPLRPRERKIRELTRAQNADDSVAFVGVLKDGVVQHAIPAAVCMAVLEYYAFEAKTDSDQAANSYRVLARKGFTDFIYEQVGYDPKKTSGIVWQRFHDRVSLVYHTVPDGYFSIFKELADMMVALIREGADLGPQFIPDISVGIAWAKHWATDNLDAVYGARRQYPHYYPGDFPQSASNPQLAYCYPDDALGEFRKWVKRTYAVKQMPAYLNNKVREGQIPAPAALKAIEAFKPKALPQ